MLGRSKTLRSITLNWGYMKPAWANRNVDSSCWERVIQETARHMSLNHVEIRRLDDAWMAAHLESKLLTNKRDFVGDYGWNPILEEVKTYCREVSDYLRCGGDMEYPQPGEISISENARNHVKLSRSNLPFTREL